MIKSRTVHRSLYHAADSTLYGDGQERVILMPLRMSYCLSDSPDSWWTGIDDDDAPGWPMTSHDDGEGAYVETMWDAPDEHDLDHVRDDRVVYRCSVIGDGCACIDVPGWCHARAGEISTLVLR